MTEVEEAFQKARACMCLRMCALTSTLGKRQMMEHDPPRLGMMLLMLWMPPRIAPT